MLPHRSSRSRALVGLLLIVSAFCAGNAVAQDITLQNDGFFSGANAAFQGGFITGEIGASRFIAPGPFPMQVKEVQFLFGGSSATHDIILRIWEDSAGTNAPGVELFNGTYQVTGSDTAFQSVDLSGDSIFIAGTFRVGIEFTHSGLPSIARDDDGTITSTLNYIDADGIGWVRSSLFGLTGDWIIRAIVEPPAFNYTVGGNVSGLSGTLVLQNNGGDDLVINADGPFTFATALSDGSAYNVTVLSDPPAQTCTVTNGSGTISGANVTNVLVNCMAAADDPSIVSITDVGNDQGRQVRVEFARSGQDQAGASTPVLEYEAYRRIDPLPKGMPRPGTDDLLESSKRLDGWDYVGSVPAHGEALYNMIAPTLADSTIANGQYLSTFFIRAATAAPTVFFDSPPAAGYSVDNLAPGVPQGLFQTGDQLTWEPAPEADFDYFAVYGSNDRVLDAGDTPLGETIGTTFSVAGSPHTWYLVTAIDFSGNEGLEAATNPAVAAEVLPSVRGLLPQVRPNPFNPGTTIGFSLSEAGAVSIGIYDLRGRHVDQILTNRTFGAGDHSVVYRSSLASGSYVLRIESGGRVETTKLTIVR